MGTAIPLGRTLTPVFRVDARWGRAVFGTPDSYEIAESNETLRTVGILRIGKPAEPVGDHLKDFYDLRPEIDDFSRPQLSAFVPPYRALRLDHQGRVWVRLQRGGESADLEWDVFSPDRTTVRRVRFPAGFRFGDANRALIVGVYVDELDVQYLQFLALPESLKRAP
jgi:hypothetical protein